MKKVIITICIVIAGTTGIACGAELLVPSQFQTIQTAVRAAKSGDTIIIAPGTYTGTGNRDIDFTGKAITVQSVAPNDPCVVAATIIDCNGTEAEQHRGFRFSRNENSDSIVSGLTITNGYGTDGGGICCTYSSPKITNCVIERNSSGSGGGIWCGNGEPAIINCTISNNKAGYNGGGIFSDDSILTITNCTIEGNSAQNGGGGIWCGYNSKLVITNGTIKGNSATGGGGIYSDESILTITNCIIEGNSAQRAGGGGICSYYKSNLAISECTIEGNAGAGILNDSIASITNCIIWDNFPRQILGAYNTTIVIYSDVQGNWPGEGNIDADPLFVQPGYWANANDPNIITEPDDPNAVWMDGDYHLLPESPCIDTGDPNYEQAEGETDLDGNPRVIDADRDGSSIIDMGAYEYQNTMPVADAGPNQVAYAWIDGLAEITLDDSASYDDDGDELTYFWNWTIDGNDFETNGISPTIDLPVGEHTIELVVNDGFVDSEPNYTTVTAIGPIRGSLLITPQMIFSQCPHRRIMAKLILPAGITRDQIDTTQKLTLYPGGIEATNQLMLPCYFGGAKRLCIFAYFDRDKVLDAIGGNRFVKVYAVGKLKTGQFFYGSNTIRIFKPGRWPRWGNMRQWFDNWNRYHSCILNKR